MTDPVPAPETWVPVLLGDVRVGDSIRVLADQVPAGNRWADQTGTIVGVRMGSITAQIGPDAVIFYPNQLERLERPE